VGLGGTTVSAIGTASGYGGLVLQIGQSWWMLYQPMIDLQYAPNNLVNDPQAVQILQQADLPPGF
jgi:hypothetical protein